MTEESYVKAFEVTDEGVVPIGDKQKKSWEQDRKLLLSLTLVLSRDEIKKSNGGIHEMVEKKLRHGRNNLHAALKELGYDI